MVTAAATTLHQPRCPAPFCPRQHPRASQLSDRSRHWPGPRILSSHQGPRSTKLFGKNPLPRTRSLAILLKVLPLATSLSSTTSGGVIILCGSDDEETIVGPNMLDYNCSSILVKCRVPKRKSLQSVMSGSCQTLSNRTYTKR
jgi:hypothetical protein